LEIRRIDILLLVLGGRTGWRIGRSECVTYVLLEIRRVEVLLLVLVWAIQFWELRDGRN